MFKMICLASAASMALTTAAIAQPHNVIIFVADGLRSRIVTADTAPGLAAVRSDGVDFQNSHSIYPTLTTPNASAIATGHRLGDTGDFGNVLYVEKPFEPPFNSVIAGVEDNFVIDNLNRRYGGDFFTEKTLLRAASEKGYSTAVIGKLGPVGLQDLTSIDGSSTIVIDDATGYRSEGGRPLPADVITAIKAAGLDAATPDRGLNGSPGAYNMPGVHVANVDQQSWYRDVTTKVLLPRFRDAGKPFVMVYWSRDPDGTQHNQGDSLNALEPGINGPTTMAAIRNASDNLQALRDRLKDLGLDKTTDIFVTADHGFSVISRQSQTSKSAKRNWNDVVPGFLPPGFLAMDLADALGLKVFDGSGYEIEVKDGFFPKRGSAVLGKDFAHPEVVVVANGGSDLIYLPGATPSETAKRVVAALTSEDYTGAVFVRDDLGRIAGTLPSSLIGMAGEARTPAPAMFVAFKSFSTGCADEELCGAEVADTDLQQGQGMHGSFGRQDTHNFMAAFGPDFKSGFVDHAAVSNADIAQTLSRVLDIDLGGAGQQKGRILTEALVSDGKPVTTEVKTTRSDPAANGFVTVLNWQTVAGVPYYDAAGMPGRTLGLKP